MLVGTIPLQRKCIVNPYSQRLQLDTDLLYLLTIYALVLKIQ